MSDFEGDVARLLAGRVHERVAFHRPCTLQHGQQIRGKVERVLRAAGVDVVLCAESHLCYGSAGTHAVLHPDIAHALRDRKLANREATGAREYVPANVGCITHLQSGRRRRCRTGSNSSTGRWRPTGVRYRIEY
nr:heterodisulfide reductase-related iron-sulfur binding cluster [Telluria antibiotica]